MGFAIFFRNSFPSCLLLPCVMLDKAPLHVSINALSFNINIFLPIWR